MPYKVNPQLCPQDHLCPLIEKCPVDAITQEGFGLPVMDAQVCIQCGTCETECPKKAVYWED